MTTLAIEKLWQFVRGDTAVNDFETWLYQTPDLELEMPADLYFDALNFNYKGSELKFIQDKLRTWLESSFTYNCSCLQFKNLDEFIISSETHLAHKLLSCDYFAIKCQQIRARTPWLEIAKCLSCDTYWYVGIDTINDDFLINRLNACDVDNILLSDIWPSFFDNNEALWPCKEWLTREGFNSLWDWQQQNYTPIPIK